MPTKKADTATEKAVKENIQFGVMQKRANKLKFKNALKVHFRITWYSPILGSRPSDPEILATYIASKAPDALTKTEEIEMAGQEKMVENGTTVFERNLDDLPCALGYQWLGFMKEACKHLRRDSSTYSASIKAFKQVINGDIFVIQRRIPLIVKEGAEMDILQRPLRIEGPQGERTALASSEMLPELTTCEFDVFINRKELLDPLLEWFDYGLFHGFSQWRNSGKGQFDYEYRVDKLEPDEAQRIIEQRRNDVIENLRLTALKKYDKESKEMKGIETIINNAQEKWAADDEAEAKALIAEDEKPKKKPGRPKKADSSENE